jgi:predicted amidohydrolase
VLLDMGPEPGEALAEIDPGEVARVRARIPSLAHARPLPAVEVVDARVRVTA